MIMAQQEFSQLMAFGRITLRVTFQKRDIGSAWLHPLENFRRVPDFCRE